MWGRSEFRPSSHARYVTLEEAFPSRALKLLTSKTRGFNEMILRRDEAPNKCLT